MVHLVQMKKMVHLTDLKPWATKKMKKTEENQKKISVWQERKWGKIHSDTMQNDRELKESGTFF